MYASEGMTAMSEPEMEFDPKDVEDWEVAVILRELTHTPSAEEIISTLKAWAEELYQQSVQDGLPKRKEEA